MAKVVARTRDSFEGMFRRWKRAVEKEGIMNELRKRECYEKPSVRRKREKAAAVKREQRRVAEERALFEGRKF